MMEGFSNNFEQEKPEGEGEINAANPQENSVESYEQLLVRARALKEQGIDPFADEDYTRSENPAVVELWDKIIDWESSCDLPQIRIETTEKANNMVKAAMLWIEAGFTSKKVLEEAYDRLAVQEIDAEKNPGNPEVSAIISATAEMVQEMMAGGKKEKGIPDLIDQAMSEARQRMEAGNFVDVVSSLTSILLSHKNKKFFQKNPEIQASVTELRDRARGLWLKK